MEDGDEIYDEIQEGEEEEGGELQGGSPIGTRPESAKKKPCNQRIDELSTPNKRIFLALWNEHAHHLPKEKVHHLKQILQESYAMSPEETAKYFEELRAEQKAAFMRRRLKQKLRKYLLERHFEKQRCRAYKLFKKLLKCGISYAARNPVPPLVSIRLRYLSDIILEQLCDLRKVGVPNRANTDKLGEFLITVADWMAIAVERLYYAAQISINEMTEQDETLLSQSIQEIGQPIASSTPKHSFEVTDETIRVENYDEFEPPSYSTPKKLSLDSSNMTPNMTKTTNPYYSIISSQPIATSTPKKPKAAYTGAANYTFSRTIKSVPEPPKAFERTHLEMPRNRTRSFSSDAAANVTNLKSNKNKKNKKDVTTFSNNTTRRINTLM